MTPEPTPSQELLISTKDSHYTLCWGEFVIAAYGTYEVAKEKLDKIQVLLKQHELSRKQEWAESLIKKLPKETIGAPPDEYETGGECDAYADGYNQCLDQITKTIKEQSKALRGVK